MAPGQNLYAVLTQRDGQSDASRAEPAKRDPQSAPDPEPDQSESDSVLCVVFVQFIDVNAKTPVAFFIGADPRGD